MSNVQCPKWEKARARGAWDHGSMGEGEGGSGRKSGRTEEGKHHCVIARPMIFRGRGNPGLNKSDNLKRRGRKGRREMIQAGIRRIYHKSDVFHTEVTEEGLNLG